MLTTAAAPAAAPVAGAADGDGELPAPTAPRDDTHAHRGGVPRWRVEPQDGAARAPRFRVAPHDGAARAPRFRVAPDDGAAVARGRDGAPRVPVP